ncbi:MAG: fasciclin domain-containing protein [Pseudomonadota bacterium]
MLTALKTVVVAAFLAVPLVGASAGEHKKDIVDTAAKAGKFNTLVEAVKAAGLVETLKGEGPFTVFAPTDAAFGKLATGQLEDLLKPANKAELKRILTYHVVPGKVMASDIAGKTTDAGTVEGQVLKVDATGDSVKAGDAIVTKTDILASNGVIHSINKVLIPGEATPKSGS